MNTNTILVDDHTLMNDLDDEAVLSGSLGGLGVRGILAEGDRLERERCDLSAGTRALAFERYRAFIAASEAGNDVADRVNDAHLAAENVSKSSPLPSSAQTHLLRFTTLDSFSYMLDMFSNLKSIERNDISCSKAS